MEIPRRPVNPTIIPRGTINIRSLKSDRFINSIAAFTSVQVTGTRRGNFTRYKFSRTRGPSRFNQRGKGNTRKQTHHFYIHVLLFLSFHIFYLYILLRLSLFTWHLLEQRTSRKQSNVPLMQVSFLVLDETQVFHFKQLLEYFSFLITRELDPLSFSSPLLSSFFSILLLKKENYVFHFSQLQTKFISGPWDITKLKFTKIWPNSIFYKR